jgi:predicted protein tyrosine phosphatase
MACAHGNITICGALDLERYSKVNFGSIISILDPDAQEPEALSRFGAHKRCTLRFHDIGEEIDNLIAPQRRHIDELLDFGRQIERDQPERILVHCFAGLCRSTAAALLLIVQNSGSPPEQAVLRMLEIVPNAWPNPRMIRFGDDSLGLDGGLVSAVQAHYDRMCELYPVFGRLMRQGAKCD